MGTSAASHFGSALVRNSAELLNNRGLRPSSSMPPVVASCANQHVADFGSVAVRVEQRGLQNLVGQRPSGATTPLLELLLTRCRTAAWAAERYTRSTGRRLVHPILDSPPRRPIRLDDALPTSACPRAPSRSGRFQRTRECRRCSVAPCTRSTCCTCFSKSTASRTCTSCHSPRVVRWFFETRKVPNPRKLCADVPSIKSVATRSTASVAAA